ncbi:MAG: PorT family protein [Muribaculaceae bacterium]|nr:PorT family protein [Muribaculaceae bacterium]
MFKPSRTLAISVFGACASILGVTASAQSHYSSRVYLGAHGGLNMSRVEFTPSVTQSFNLGANAGINFRYVEEKHFGFIVELNWEQRGWKEDFEDLPYNYTRTANYIQLPFLAHVYFGSRAKFFINAGPSVSFKVGESTSTNIDLSSVSSNPDFKSRITYQMYQEVDLKVDYGIQGGIGGEYSINRNNSIYLDARFYFGLGNMLKSGRTDPIRGSNPMTISVSLGYWFRLK